MRTLSIAAALLLAGCATEGTSDRGANDRTAEDAQDQFVLKSPGGAVTFKVNSEGMTNPYTNIGHYGNELRGTVDQSNALELEYDDTSIKGTVGPNMVDLHVTLASPQVRMQGLYAGSQSDIVIGPDSVVGRIGLCYVEMHKDGDHYTGQRTCSGNTRGAQMWLPKALTSFPVSQFCAYMAVLLSSTQ